MLRIHAVTTVAPMLLAIVLLTGCESGPAASPNRTSPLDPQELPRMAVVESFSLGGVDAPEASAFIRVPPLEVGPDGSLFLLARSANEVRRFGPDGTFLNTIGREGEGPGEFENANLFGLVFFDSSNATES